MSSESHQTRLNGRVAIETDNVNRIFFAAVMARFAVSAAYFVYAPHASQAEIILFVETMRKSPYLCISF